MHIRQEAYISTQHSHMLPIHSQLTVYRKFELGDLDGMYVYQWYFHHGKSILEVTEHLLFVTEAHIPIAFATFHCRKLILALCLPIKGIFCSTNEPRYSNIK